MTYQPWYRRYPERFDEEVKAMQNEGFTLDQKLLEVSNSVVFRGFSRRYPSIELVIVYPDSFPGQPPHVYFFDDILTTHHHPQTKELCTFGFGGSRWSADANGTTSITEVEEILALNVKSKDENPPTENPPTESIQSLIGFAPEPASDYYRYEDRIAVFIPPNLTNYLISLPDKVQGYARFRFVNRSGLHGVLTQVSIKGKTVTADTPYSKWCSKGAEYNATILKLDKPIPWTCSSKDMNQFLQQNGINVTKGLNFILFSYPEDYLERGNIRTSFLLISKSQDGDYKYIRCMVLDIADKRTRIPEFQGLEKKRVLIIGCGSIGSRISSELARLGVSMTLVDPDIHTLGSLLRHECGINDIGDFKVCALHNRIQELNPELHDKIRLATFRIGSSSYPINKNFDNYLDFVQHLHEVDLIIEATGQHGLRWYLNDLAFTYNKPIIFSWVTEGAWGGEAVRVIPGETGCYLCWRDNRIAEAPSAPLNRLIFAPGCSQPTFTGTSFDIMDFVAKVTRIVIQTFLRGEQGNYPDSPGNHLVWSCRGPDGNLLLETKFYPVVKKEGCPFC